MTDKYEKDLQLKAKYDEGNGLFYVIDVDGDVNDNFDSIEEAESYVARYYQRYWKAKAGDLSPEAMADSLARTWAVKAAQRDEANKKAKESASDILRCLICGYGIDENVAYNIAIAAAERSGIDSWDIDFDIGYPL